MVKDRSAWCEWLVGLGAVAAKDVRQNAVETERETVWARLAVSVIKFNKSYYYH